MKAVEIDIPHGVALIVLFVFCVVVADRDTGMAALAQSHEISCVVGTPVYKRNDMVHFLCERQPAFLFALLTNWMRLNIELTYASPCSTVALAGVWIALVFVVMVHGDLPMFVTVATV